jgi:hypothetical protein
MIPVVGPVHCGRCHAAKRAYKGQNAGGTRWPTHSRDDRRELMTRVCSRDGEPVTARAEVDPCLESA